jgi:NAD(P)-dependent dehydrogenase (short-subunit alcohol dehydrogenase family)
MATLSGKVAWLTGAGSGIGQAGAIGRARAGARVVISGRRAEMLEDTRRLVMDACGDLEKLPLDVADKKQGAHAAKALLDRHGRCDILLNSAGLNVPKRFYKDLVYAIADMAIMPRLRLHEQKGVDMAEYATVKRWFDKITERPVVKRGLQVPVDRRRTGPLTPKQREAMFGSVQSARR